MKIAKKVEDRIKNGAVKFKKVLEAAKNRDLNESDTVAIITDMLAEVFGYEKYSDIKRADDPRHVLRSGDSAQRQL